MLSVKVNDSAPVEADDATFYSLLIVSPLGLIANVLLLITTLNSKEIRKKDYTLFILNRSVIDALFSLQLFILQPLAMKYFVINPLWCKVASGISETTIWAIIIWEPVLACNHYVSICHSNFLYNKLFRKRNVLIMAAVVWLLAALIVLPHVFDDTFGKVPGLICIANLDSAKIMMILYIGYPPLCVSYGITSFCYFKIYQFLKAHKNQSTTLGQQSSFKENKSLLRYIGALALLPIFTEAPLAIAAAIRMLTLVPDSAIFAVTLILMLSPVINPLMTLYIIRPIRKEFLRLLKSFCKCDESSTQVFSVQNMSAPVRQSPNT